MDYVLDELFEDQQWEFGWKLDHSLSEEHAGILIVYGSIDIGVDGGGVEHWLSVEWLRDVVF